MQKLLGLLFPLLPVPLTSGTKHQKRNSKKISALQDFCVWPNGAPQKSKIFGVRSARHKCEDLVRRSSPTMNQTAAF